MRWIYIATALLISINFSAQAQEETPQPFGESIVVGTLNSPTTWYWSGTEHTGLEYQLAAEFSKFLNTQIELRAYDTPLLLAEAFNSGEVDLVAGDIDLNQLTINSYVGPSYRTIEPIIVYHDSNDFEAIAESKGIIDHVSLFPEQQSSDALATTRPNEATQPSALEALDAVNRGELAYAIVDQASFEHYAVLYPRLKIAESDNMMPIQRRWLVQSERPGLAQLSHFFFALDSTQKLVAEAIDAEKPRVSPLDYLSARSFTHLMRTRLPRYEADIRTAAEANELPYSLIAAMSFQESHWNPDAISPTGVRGFMMLTQVTAREMGVTNRMNLDQSIDGGTRYIRRLISQFSGELNEQDRVAFALASYNIGRGHLEDARRLAARDGADADSWDEVAAYVLQLEDPETYRQTRYGYARGSECVSYVRNILQFQQLIAWNDQVHSHSLAGLSTFALQP